MRGKLALILLAATAAAGLLSGFGGAHPGAPGGRPAAGGQRVPGRQPSPSGRRLVAAFPVSVTTGSGTVRITSRPTRILSLSPSATQMLYAVGAGSQVVGVDKYSTYPPDAPRTQFTGGESSAEDYLVLRPDLVILAFDSSHLVAQLKTLHIPALLFPPAASLDDAYRQLREIGAATGHSAAAARAVASLQRDLARTATSVTAARGKSYYIELDPTLYTATSKTFIGALLGKIGMRNVADPAGHGSSYPQLSPEFLLKANPDYVFLADTICCGQTAATFARRPGFGHLKAVRLHHVVALDDSLASEWGPHSMEGFLEVVGRAVSKKAAA